MKNLVAFFSASGVTKGAAQKLAAAANADLFEIVPKVPYTKADLDWTDKKSRSTVEMKNPDSRPEIAEKLNGIEKYDTIYIGFPIWWYVAPTIINTFLESYDFSGKTIVLFATSGSSGLGKTAEVLKKSCNDSTKIISGRLLNRASDSEIRSLIDSAGN